MERRCEENEEGVMEEQGRWLREEMEELRREIKEIMR